MSSRDRRRFFRLRSGLLAGIGLVLALLAIEAPLSAAATDPVDLDGAYIVERTGVLGNRAAQVQDALDELATEVGVTLFQVSVDPNFALKLLSHADATARAVPGLIAAGRASEAAVSIRHHLCGRRVCGDAPRGRQRRRTHPHRDAADRCAG